jgi:hypothetical protein
LHTINDDLTVVGPQGFNSAGEKGICYLGNTANFILAEYDGPMAIGCWNDIILQKTTGGSIANIAKFKTTGDAEFYGAGTFSSAKGDSGHVLEIKNTSGYGSVNLYRQQNVSSGNAVSAIAFSANTSNVQRGFAQIQARSEGGTAGFEAGSLALRTAFSGAFIDSVIVKGYSVTTAGDVSIGGGCKTDKDAANAVALKWKLITGNLDNDASTTVDADVANIVGVLFSIQAPTGWWVAEIIGDVEDQNQLEVKYGGEGTANEGLVVIEDVGSALHGAAYKMIVFYA